MRRYLRLASILIAALAFVVPAVAQDMPVPDPVGLRPDAPTYALRGPHWVGVRQFTIDDGETPMNVTVWYPALNPEGLDDAYVYAIDAGPAMPPMTIHGRALPEAMPDLNSAPYPLVVYSPGSGAAPEHHLPVPEHLASYGFVVIGGMHPGNTTPEFIASFASEEATAAYEEQLLLNEVTRPQDITREIDYAETLTAADGALAGMIDLEKIAVAGASFGGYTSLAAGGATLDFGELREWLQTNTPADPLVNLYPDHEDEMAALIDQNVVLGERWPSLGDPRIDAIVPMAPGDVPLMGDAGLAAVTVPTLIITGSADPIAPQNAFWAYEGLGSPEKLLVSFENAGHMIFNFRCEPWAIEMGFADRCMDEVWDMDRAHDLLNHFTTAFLLDVLKGDADAAAALTPDAVSFPGIAYEAVGF